MHFAYDKGECRSDGPIRTKYFAIFREKQMPAGVEVYPY